MWDNSQEIPVQVIYYTNSRIISKKEFGSFAHFGALLNYFERHLKKNGTKLKQKYFLNNQEIEFNDLLTNLIQPIDKNRKISKVCLSLEVEERKTFGNKYSPWHTKILQPKIDPFALYIINSSDYSISLRQFPKKVQIENELDKINENSAYCNSTKDLFISGGISEGKNITHFWIINNEYFGIRKTFMKYPKSNHSMIYINNDNNELVFIAGGNDIKTFYYDIQYNKFVFWGNMLYSHYHPALISD